MVFVRSLLGTTLWAAPLLAVCTLAAQHVDTSIEGRVADGSGSAVVDAAVAVAHVETGRVRSQETDAEGRFAVAMLAPGSYTVSVTADGFKTARSEPVRVSVGDRVRRDVVLELGPSTETITVTATASAVDTNKSSLGTTVPNQFITDLPLNGRNFLELALLAPGTTLAAVGSPGTERGRFAFQVNGARESTNAFHFDGVYAMDPILNSFVLVPPVDAVEEFIVQTSNSEAGLGRNSGGQIAVVTKRGTKDWHGTAYGFLRNDRLDARNFFSRPDDPVPTLRRNQFGASLGGPAGVRDTFFFANFEGLRESRGITRTTNVPTAEERSGDFSMSASPPPIDLFSGGIPFPNGRLPFVHPIGQGIAGLYPLPNRATRGQNFVAAPDGMDNSDRVDARLDSRTRDNHHLALRYSTADIDRYEPYAAQQFSSVPGYGNNLDEDAHNLMVSSTTTTSRAVTEVRFGFTGLSNSTVHENSGNNLNATVGLPEFTTMDLDRGLSFVQVTGYSSLGGEFNNPQVTDTRSLQASFVESLTRGRHLLQFGADFRSMRQDGFRHVLARGSLYFTDQAFTRNALADLLFGAPSYTLVAQSDNDQAVRTALYSGFASDTWRVSQRLTLTMGLRYEFNTPPYDAHDAASVYDPGTASIVRLGASGVPRGGFDSDSNNFAPRFGLAFRPSRSDRFVLRAGWGVHYNFADLASGQGIYFNPPFFQSMVFFPSRQLPLTVADPWPQGAAAPIPPGVTTYDRALRTSYAQQWNFTAQAEPFDATVISLTYSGTRGTKLIGARDINQPQPSPVQPNYRPLPMFSDINLIASSFDSAYHSLQARYQCRLRDGLTGLFSYTWSKSIDNASNFFASSGDANYPQDSTNIAAERGRSSFDTPHRFVGSFVYEVPVGPGKTWGSSWSGATAWLLAGWQVNGVASMQAGQPYTVALPGELDNSNTGRSSYGFGAGDRPNLVGDPRLASPDPQLWFDPAAFAMPSYGSFGNAGRNIISGPGLANVDFSLLKNAALGESANLQFRAEFFNLTNTPNFLNPNVFFGTPGFGRILGARNGREVQFGIKLIF